MTISFEETRPGERIVSCFCRRCGAKTDGAVQHQDARGEWGPDLGRTLDAQGWVIENEVLFCGKHCAVWYRNIGRRELEARVEPVETIADKNYQDARRLAKTAPRAR